MVGATVVSSTLGCAGDTGSFTSSALICGPWIATKPTKAVATAPLDNFFFDICDVLLLSIV